MFRQRIGSGVTTGNLTITITVAVAVGETIIVAISTGSTTSISSVTDTAGNTYTIDFQSPSGTRRVGVASAPVTTAITTSDTISVNTSGAGDTRAAAYEYAGLLNGADKSAGAVGTAVTTLATGSSGTLTQNSEVIFTVLGGPAITGMTDPSGYNDRPPSVSLNALYVADLTVYDTTAVNLTWSWTTSSNAGACVVTYMRQADNFLSMF